MPAPPGAAVTRCLRISDRVLEANVASGGTGMKIEIGEFLILSWLRHVRGCVVTQMNWSPSPAWTVARERELRATFEAVRTFSDDTIGRSASEIDFESFVRHARIDVLGLRAGSRFRRASRRSPSIRPSTTPSCRTAMPRRRSSG